MPPFGWMLTKSNYRHLGATYVLNVSPGSSTNQFLTAHYHESYHHLSYHHLSYTSFVLPIICSTINKCPTEGRFNQLYYYIYLSYQAQLSYLNKVIMHIICSTHHLFYHIQVYYCRDIQSVLPLYIFALAT